MASVNRVIIIGNLGQDPTTRYAQDGSAVSNISVACTHTWKDKSGEKQEETEWVRVVAFGRLAEVMVEYLHKGSQVYVEGRLQTKKWTDKENIERYTTQVVAGNLVMLGPKPQGQEAREARDNSGRSERPSREASQPAATKTPAGGGGHFDDMEDDIPFLFNMSTISGCDSRVGKSLMRARRGREALYLMRSVQTEV